MKKLHLTISLALTALLLTAFIQANGSQLQADVLSAAENKNCPIVTPSFNPHIDGITKKCFPDGLPFPSFNNYVDAHFNAGSTDDERTFMRARLTTENVSAYRRTVNVNPQLNQIIKFQAYVHNDGDPAKNGTPEALTALNTKTKIDSFSLIGQDYVTQPGTDLTITQHISASNTVPTDIQDSIRIVSATGTPIRLKYVFTDVNDVECPSISSTCFPAKFKFRYPPDYTRGHDTFFMSDDLFVNGAALEAPEVGQNYRASEGNRGYIYFSAKVVAVEQPPPLPTLTLVKTVDNTGGGTLTPGNFQFRVQGGPNNFDQTVSLSANGTVQFAQTLQPGTYTVSEVNIPGQYQPLGWGGGCLPAGATTSTITLAFDESKLCSITNRFIPPTPPPPPTPIYIPPVTIIPPVIVPSPSARQNQPVIPALPRGTLTKRAYRIAGTSAKGNVVKNGERVEFKISFRASADVPVVSISEESIGNDLTLYGNQGGTIKIDPSSFKVRRQPRARANKEVSLCSAALDKAGTPCYKGTLFSGQGIVLPALTDDDIVTITYQGTVTSKINEASCRRASITRSRICGEEFINRIHDSLKNTASAKLYTPCPFILTKGIGDVILEKDLQAGVDTGVCFETPNIEGPVIIPTPEPTRNLTKTGVPPATLNIPFHELCMKSNNNVTAGDTRPTGYQNPLESVSSAVCELSLSLAQKIQAPQVRSSIEENITRITRNNSNLGVGTARTIGQNLINKPLGNTPPLNQNFEIYKLTNGTLTIQGDQIVTAGARTYVIEHGDLIINGNISYDTTQFKLSDAKNIPSIAFIVLDGDIKVAPHVTKLAGVFVTVNGKLTSTGESSEKPLTINGSIFGDIQPLFISRTAVGEDPRQNKGALVINYDGRLFYNMPPGLKEILNVTEEQVVR